jgi:hypothetical protein
MLTNSGIFKAEGARAMTDNWEPSDAAVEAALDAYERTPGFADSVRAALIAAHAVAEQAGRSDCLNTPWEPESAFDAERISAALGITEDSACHLIDEATRHYGAREWADFDDYLRDIRVLYREMSNTRGT